MNVVPPTWYSRRPCPVCDQGQSLAFVACPQCNHVMLLCEEEGSVFEAPLHPSASKPDRYREDACPSCGAGKIVQFDDARDVQVIALGLGPADYE